MKWAVRLIQGLLAIMFLLSGFMKLSGDPTQVKSFTDIYEYGVGFMYVVGVMEVLAALGLIIAYWKRNVLFLSSGVLIIIMIGAVMTHLIAGQGFAVAITPFILLALTAFILFSQLKLKKSAKTEEMEASQ